MSLNLHPGTLFAVIAIVAGLTIYSFIRSRHAERMQQLQMGMPLDNESRLHFELKFGLLFTGVGFGILMAYIVNILTLQDTDELYPAFIFLFGGIGLFSSFFVARKFGKKA
ncbi:MAG: hypothetical protein KI786_17910 [Mameliella sp.]|nr:hypothetical protein [Phaeodactylibacter sp.]NRA51113.1 hypothetical protein [Phaeodactylibacter sp.]